MAIKENDLKSGGKDNWISLMPKEGKSMIRSIDLNVAKMCTTLKNMVECTKAIDEAQPVPLPDVSAKVLDKIIEYLNYHVDDPIEDKDSDDEEYNDIKRSDDMCEWDRKFISEVDRDTLFQLIQAANFLNIKGLLELGCKTAANQIKGKTAEEVRALWGITCDLSPEEEERLKQENAWAEDNN